VLKASNDKAKTTEWMKPQNEIFADTYILRKLPFGFLSPQWGARCGTF
jgi:hypothetical protein